MAIVTNTFQTTSAQNWASATWTSADLSHLLNTQLSAWVTAINDSSVIDIIHNPGDATSRGSTDYVRWILRARGTDTASDYGFVFCERQCGRSSSSTVRNGCYYARSANSANNNAGTFSVIGPTLSGFGINDSYVGFTAYEASGTTPWFLFRYDTESSTSPNAFHLLTRLSTSNIEAGSYYPGGVGKWVYIFGSNASGRSQLYVQTPQANISLPFMGVPTSAFNLSSIAFAPSSPYGNGLFWRMPALYGPVHYLGVPTKDIIISNSQTGLAGDTVVFSGSIYKKLNQELWAKIG